MRLVIDQAGFEFVLCRTIGIASPRQVMPVLNGVLLRAERGVLAATAFDLEIAVTAEAAAEVQEDGSIVLPARQLLGAVKLLRGPLSVTLIRDAVAEIESEDTRLELSGFRSDDFPALPKEMREPSTHEARLPAGELASLFRQTAYAVSTDVTRMMLSGLFLESTGPDVLRALGMDGYRAAAAERTVAGASGLQRPLLLPGRAAAEMSRALAEFDGEVALSAGERSARLDLGRTQIVARLVDHEYVDWTRSVPDPSGDLRLVVPRKRFIESIRRAAQLATATGGTRTVLLEICDGEIRTSGQGLDGRATDVLRIEHNHPVAGAKVNPLLMLDALESIDDEVVHVDLPCGAETIFLRSADGVAAVALMAGEGS